MSTPNTIEFIASIVGVSLYIGLFVRIFFVERVRYIPVVSIALLTLTALLAVALISPLLGLYVGIVRRRSSIIRWALAIVSEPFLTAYRTVIGIPEYYWHIIRCASVDALSYESYTHSPLRSKKKRVNHWWTLRVTAFDIVASVLDKRHTRKLKV